MGVIFTENEKRLELSVEGYEFEYLPDEITDTGTMWDANWLMVRVDYSENGQNKTFKENCLQTFELQALTAEIKNITNGSETKLVKGFTEPNLLFSVSSEKGVYRVNVQFSPDDGKEISVLQTMTLDELRETNERLKAIAERFPEKRLSKSRSSAAEE